MSLQNQKHTGSEQDKTTQDEWAALRQELVGGLLYCHDRANTNTSKTLEVMVFAYALIELLLEKGLLTEEEINDRKRQVALRLVEKLKDSGMGVMLQQPEIDKRLMPMDPSSLARNRRFRRESSAISTLCPKETWLWTSLSKPSSPHCTSSWTMFTRLIAGLRCPSVVAHPLS